MFLFTETLQGFSFKNDTGKIDLFQQHIAVTLTGRMEQIQNKALYWSTRVYRNISQINKLKLI